MDNESIQIIRQSSRNILKSDRQSLRDAQTDCGRNIINDRITNEAILDIVNKLKTKSSVAEPELHILKNIIIDDQKNIELVLGVHGALKGLVRELTGTDVKKQIAAAGCFCNLALSDSKGCSAVAKLAGPYLILGLDSPTTEIAVLSCWTLGNLMGSGPRICATLMDGGAIHKLITKFPDQRISEAALCAMLHCAYQMKNTLSKEYLGKILHALSTLEINMASSHLLFVLSCHQDFKMDSPVLHKLLRATSSFIDSHNNQCAGVNQCCELLYVIRTLANSDEFNCEVLRYFEVEIGAERLVRTLCGGNRVISESLLWLLGNLYNTCGDSDIFNELNSVIINI
ncbi:hypothetical protein ACJJTC_013992 [Scirpophaga incertulas]